jgi:hypothetical protein
MQLYHETSGLRETPSTDAFRKYPLSAQNALSDGTTHVIFQPLDIIARLAALVPKPGVNLTRFHRVFAPHSKHRVDVTPAKRGKGRVRKESEDQAPAQRHKAMTLGQGLKRVFDIDVSVCQKCGGEATVIACIEDQAFIDKIQQHLQDEGAFRHCQIYCLRRGPRQIQTGLHSHGFSHRLSLRITATG